jgi:glycosyltransferase involved in cell wall biosynthesis
MSSAPQSAPLQVILVGNYPLDRIESMDRFTASLGASLRARDVRVTHVAPKPKWGLIWGTYRYRGLPKWLGYIDKYLVFPRELRRAVAAARRQGPVVVHITDHGNAMYVPARRDVPWLVTCHDLLTVRAMLGHDTAITPSWTGRRQQRWIVRGLLRADHVACDSDFSRQDLRSLFPKHAAEKSSTVWIGLNHPYRRIESTEVRCRLGAAGHENLLIKPYLLHVGSNLKRKNREGVLRVMARLRDRNLNLVLAGPALPPELLALAGELGVADRLIVVERPDNDLLEALYNAAHALLFPSYFEGFGWPVLEAQACGCPVICSDRSSVPEVAGQGALLRSPEDPTGMADDVLRLFDATDRANLVARGNANVVQFTPAVMADKYAALYGRLINGFSSTPDNWHKE